MPWTSCRDSGWRNRSTAAGCPGDWTAMAKTNAHYLNVLLRQASALGLGTESLLEDANVAPGMLDEQWVDNQYLASLVKLLWRQTGDETVGLGAAPMKPGSW